MQVTREIFEAQKYPRFGSSNPEAMDMEFWKLMIRNGESAIWARGQFGATYEDTPSPVWSFERFGMTRTELADGRVICIAGEHEDFYDRDFNIYNDVIVFFPDNEIAIFGYPKEDFPPTDFHTATLIEDQIIVIGTLGYVWERQPGVTNVHRLDCNTYHMERLDTQGDNPGWISGHEAMAEDSGSKIIVTDGQIFEWQGEGSIQQRQQIYRGNPDYYQLDLTTLRWTRV